MQRFWYQSILFICVLVFIFISPYVCYYCDFFLKKATDSALYLGRLGLFTNELAGS
jgi:hypothetical protein